MVGLNEYMKATNSLIRVASRYLSKEHYNYNIRYAGRSLEIVSKDMNESTRLYFRIAYLGDHFSVDFSNIDLDPSIRHHGIFTNMVNDLKRSRSIKQIWVSSILTQEMWDACNKLGFKIAPEINGCKLDLRQNTKK